MTWKGLNLIVQVSHQVYKKGISLGKAAMRIVEQRLERNPLLPKWDTLFSGNLVTGILFFGNILSHMGIFVS